MQGGSLPTFRCHKSRQHNPPHAQVGISGKSGLSVEQRKRLTIAVELVANPSIIYMDEPTSGLDARAAAIVMRAVRNIVNTGRTIVCTIHQPSIDIFESFDELLLLKVCSLLSCLHLPQMSEWQCHGPLKNIRAASTPCAL